MREGSHRDDDVWSFYDHMSLVSTCEVIDCSMLARLRVLYRDASKMLECGWACQ